jgi:hypothetical protein
MKWVMGQEERGIVMIKRFRDLDVKIKLYNPTPITQHP